MRILVFAVTLPAAVARLAPLPESESKWKKPIRRPQPRPPVLNCDEDSFVDEATENGALVQETEDGFDLSWDDPEYGDGQVISIFETVDIAESFAPNDVGRCLYCADCLDVAGLPDDWPVCGDVPGADLDVAPWDDRRLSWISWGSSVCRAFRIAEAVAGPLPPLPNCPCFGPPAGPGWTPPAGGGIFHPGAAACVRSAGGPGFAAGQQCCYDAAGALITGGKGAGTPDRVAPDDAAGIGAHFCVDVVPFFGCSCSTYLGLRPPNTGAPPGCAANVVSPCWF